MTSNPYPRLWLTAEDETEDAERPPKVPPGFSNDGSTESFIRARMVPNTDLVSLKVQRPPQKHLLAMVGNSLVVGQEFSLTCLFLERHRAITPDSDDEGENGRDGEWTQVTSMVVLVFTVMVILYYSEAAQNSMACENGRGRTRKRDKMILRSTDALLLAAILRLLSAVLRTLTASYSSDTVNALAIGGMIVHLLACDYSYANGVQRKAPIASSSRIKRPTFMGGTISLNAALFSTTLLASRLPTNAVSYVFISWAVILFAFYPAARHAIATTSGDSFASPCFVITTAIAFATSLLLFGVEKMVFLAVLFCICVVSPTAKWWLHRHKKIIVGPWDIAHIIVDNGQVPGE